MRLLALTGLALLLATSSLAATTPPQARTPAASTCDAEATWQQIRSRLTNPHIRGYLSSAKWALDHAGGKEPDAAQALRLMAAIRKALEQERLPGLEEFKGVCGVLGTMTTYLQSRDEAVRGFAAVFLGAAGHKSSIPALGAILTEPARPPDKDPSAAAVAKVMHEATRARVALALGLLGARTQLPAIVAMLSGASDSERSAAPLAIAEMGAVEHAGAIAALLEPGQFAGGGVRQSAITALITLKAAKTHSARIAQVVQDELSSEERTTAMYALVHIGAKQHADAIAKVLQLDYFRGHAAKALALLGAAKYKTSIAKLLTSNEALEQKDAALALGILGAVSERDRIAALLSAPDDFVRLYAAFSLALLGAGKHAPTMNATLDLAAKQGYWLNGSDLHPLVQDRLAALDKRLRAVHPGPVTMR